MGAAGVAGSDAPSITLAREHSAREAGLARAHASRLQDLCVDQRRAASAIVAIFPALALIAANLVEANGGLIRLFDMQPNGARPGGARRVFSLAQQFATDAAAALFRKDFDGLDVGDQVAGFGCPIDDRESHYNAIFLRDPGRGTGGIDEFPQVGAAEAMRRLKTGLLDRKKLGEIVRDVSAIDQGCRVLPGRYKRFVS